MERKRQIVIMCISNYEIQENQLLEIISTQKGG